MADLITMMAAAAGVSAGGGYQISRSLRFNSADSAYLSKAFASNSDATQATFSFWHKRSVLATEQQFYAARDSTGNNNNRFFISYVTDFIRIRGYDSSGNLDLSLDTSAIYRDVSSWYHIFVVLDTTQATSSDRVKLYVNGELVTAFSSSTYPSLNQTFRVANSVNNAIGYTPGGSAYLNGYLTEYHFLDGVAASVSSFGEINATTGVWSPIAYAGTYGTNGFYLDFSDNTSTTTLGYDAAGSNDWTLNNFSVTAGAGNDSLVDSPTQYGTDTGAGGEVRGNYCTLNPLDNGGLSLTNGNLDAENTAASNIGCRSTFVFPSSGKWYCEATALTLGGNLCFGVSPSNQSAAVGVANNHYILINSSLSTVQRYNGGSSITYTGFSAYSTGAILQIAFDADNQKVWFGLNNVWMDGGTTATGNPATGANATLTGLTNVFPGVSLYTSKIATNFGQRPFAYTAPSGFKALCTTNLPDPTVVQGDDYFNTVLWTGTDVSAGRSITGVGFAPDFVWSKPRSLAYQHNLYDAVRGVGKRLQSNATDAESTNVVSGYISSFDADGFTTSAGSTNNENFNDTGDTYVAWNWNAGGSNATNTDGTITSTVRANPTAGFSIVSYTGTGSAATIGHGLGAAPAMIIVKNRDQADAWQVYHAANTANPETDYLVLNTTAVTADAADRWNDTAPTSTVFSIGNGVEVNTNTEDYIAYCFAAIPGFSAFGSYTGNGSADGPFAFLDFRPAFLMIKRTDVANGWLMIDSARDIDNVTSQDLQADLSNAESTANRLDFLSNGFKLRSTFLSSNASGGTYIYIAFAENPFKNALAR